MANFKPKDWARFKERTADRAAKARLEKALHMTLPEWSIVVWGDGAALYNPTPEMFEERMEDLSELLSNGSPESCNDQSENL